MSKLETRCFDALRNRWEDWHTVTPEAHFPDSVRDIELVLRPFKVGTVLALSGPDCEHKGTEQFRLVPDVCDKCQRPL